MLDADVASEGVSPSSLVPLSRCSGIAGSTDELAALPGPGVPEVERPEPDGAADVSREVAYDVAPKDLTDEARDVAD